MVSVALVHVTRAAICGSDLWPYNQMEHNDSGRRMGHEFIGVVGAVGAEVQTNQGRRHGRLVVRRHLCVIILLGRHADRIALARDFGATDIVSERG
jgi:threonine dehydrogenase-like Zn-dependent dehydrogenase